MAVIYDDDVAPAVEPGASTAVPKARGRFVPDAAPAAAPSAAAVSSPADKSPSVLERLDKLSRTYNPLDPRQALSGDAVLPNPVQGFLQRGGEATLGLGGKILAGFHGLGTALTGGNAADTIEADRAALTPTPAHTASAQQFDTLASGVAKPFQAVAAPVDRAVANAGPLISTAVPAASEAIQDIASVLPAAALESRAAGKMAAATTEGAAKPSVQSPLETARGAGYQAPPSVVAASNPGARVPGTTREAIIGPSGVQGNANVANQQLTTRLLGEDLGLNDAKKVTANDAANFRKTGPGPKYDTTAEKLGFMPPDSAAADELTAMVADQNPASALAPKARTNVDRIVNKIGSGSYTGSDWLKDVSWLRENGARSAADSLEDMAERHLSTLGDTDTLATYRGARTDFAKSYDIQNAIGRGGQLDAQHFRNLDDKYPGMLTGNAKIVATAARELPEVTRLPGAETGGGLHTKFQAVHNAVGGLIKKAPGMNPLDKGFQDRNFGRQQTPTEASYNPTFGRRDQTPATERPADPTGGLTLADDSGPLQPQTPRGEGIPLANVLSTGVERPAPLGLSLSPMGVPRSDAIPFTRDAGQMAGDLQLADSAPRSLGEALSDVAGVRSQGVPDGGMARTPSRGYIPSSDTVDFEPRERLGLALAPGKAYEAGQRELFGKSKGAVKKRGKKD